MAYVFTGEMRFGSLGLGFTSKQMGMGIASVHKKCLYFALNNIPQSIVTMFKTLKRFKAIFLGQIKDCTLCQN